uniref:Uncharacterized protein n=1 Tax=Arundo donax TaxID=35708 RepID=A0A0A9BYG4_ARUDO
MRERGRDGMVSAGCSFFLFILSLLTFGAVNS